jgi:MSHA biogenesis protein MshK
VIDGETVRLGGTFRGAVLVRMTETEVELQRGRERQVLKLFAAARPKAGAGVQP